MNELEELFEQQITLKKIYKTNAIRVATFLGGPIVSGYLIAENFKALGQDRQARITWIVTALFTAVILAISLLVPGVDRVRMLMPLLYSFAAYYLVDYFQRDSIKDHLSEGGEEFGWGRVIVVSLIGLAFTVALFFGIIFLAVEAGLVN